MTGQQLKNSILQMAVQGKLVPQDPNDEPASVLLERIRAEKEKLIKEGKIKKEKNPSVIFRGADNLPYEKLGKNAPVCIADEVPFEIPESWEWCRIGELFFLQAGKNISSSSISEKPFANAIPCYGGNGIRGYVKSSNRSGDYPIIGRQGALCGNINRATGDFYATEHAVCVTTFSNTNVSWACVFLKALNLNQYATATAQPGLAVGTINRVLIPVPPVTEQRRITEKLYLLEPLLASYESTHDLIINQQHDFPEQLKKSILQEAVQGKLVPQDPTDEPASALLERIRAEKEQLIKSGKIKRDKHESVIFRRDNSYYERVDGIERCIDDEIPFEIPENWEVVRLQNIGEYRKGPFGSSLTKSMFVPKSKSSIKVYEQKNAIQKDCTLGTYYIPMEYYNEKMKGFTVLPNDIIVSCAGTIGETYILPSSAEIGIINQALMRMRITSQINVDYFLIYFDYMVKETARESSKGSAIKNIPPFDIFKKIILPLPPLKEQKRIVQEVHTIQSLISSL
mgnify:FL=1